MWRSAADVSDSGDSKRYASNFGIPPVLSFKSFHAAGRIDQFLLAGEERVAFGADFQVDFRFRRTRFEGFAASALDDGVDVVRMYVCFHQASSNLLLYIF